ncbi:MAG: endonuclease III [Helicobacteraceae bacterium]|jgi:endonuclease-3|nr:endonuclease III [Helicobacteraceae bacterium]
MTLEGYLKALDILAGEYPKWNAPAVTLIATSSRDPYLVLISTLLSLRTKDETTAKASERLFALAKTPEEMIKLKAPTIQNAIYPVGFYRDKAERILEISQRLIDDFGGKVPSDLDTLTSFKGVGRKTANLVVSLGFNLPAVCVDTHVHRISNILGFARTKTPEETETAIRKRVPIERWSGINDLLVAFGQTICKSVSPLCSKCPIASLCEKNGVKKHR